MDIKELLTLSADWLLSSGIRIAIIIIMMFITLKLAGVLSRRLFAPFKKDKLEAEMQKRADTLSSLLKYILSVSIVVIALIMILGEFGIKIGPILAAAGIVGLAVGFGSQQLVQDVISGFFILMEDQIRVGDVINIAGKGGLVEKITLRTTTLRDLAGNVHFVRNGHIDIVTNMTKEFSFYVFDIGVAYRENVDEVIDVIKKVDEELRNDTEFSGDIMEPIEIMGLDKFADSAVVIKARIKTKPIKQWQIGREFNRRLKMAFDAKNIEIPFPHMTVYMGQNKDGQAPPLHVNMGTETAEKAN
ncbi:MAG TPA: mechanosensitive ion channel family protein [candidate division Zixibacteria bacterium]|nr:mechanosensitive ion channel family protein [candidate division Zixibacteria bacterium]